MEDEHNKQVNINKVTSDNDTRERQSHKEQISWGERRRLLIAVLVWGGRGHFGF